jgi:DNA-binding beta-propeller fold protein YncE
VWAANPLCNTIIPESYHAPVFAGRTLTALSSTYSWLAALIVLLAASTFAVERIVRLGASSLFRLLGLFVTGWLVVLTGRAAWTASYINYDYPTEFLVYAHSSGANKEVMAQVEEISLKTLGGYALRVAYDARVSWPLTWYMRNYPNAVHFGNEPSRGLIGDAPVIIAGTSNWARIEPLVGDRYYQFEYIRMWWPMQDYFDLTWQDLRNAARDPALQRGLWEIFYSRDYDAYADAVAVYRNGNRPNFDLSQWPVPDRMRVWIRKDVFAQIWDYGVAASEIAEAVDPYAAGTRLLAPDAIFGQGLLNRPHGMAAGADGTIYVADSFNHRIAVFDQNGSLVRTLGRYVLAPEGDGFNEPWSVAVATDGTVYVADTWNHRVVVYGADGAYINSWGFEGPTLTTDVYAFWGPRGIAVDEDGNVYLADTGNKRIMVYEPDGTFIRQIGSGGPLEGQLDEPAGLAFGPDGLLYVADTWNQRIQVFTREGLFIRQWYVEAWFAQSNERPYIAVDDQGRVYVTDPDASRVIVFDAFGQYLYSFGDLSTIGLAGSVAVFGDSLFVVDTESGSVQRYTLLPEAAP